MPNKNSPDGLNMQFIKDNFGYFSNIIINIVNSSLELGVVPNKLKVSTIIPIRKVPNTKKIEEFRPINMLPAMEKIIEKIVFKQLMEHVNKNNILTKYQSAFRKGYSCETALHCLLNEWKGKIDQNMMTMIIFLDLSRAFETIDRYILLKKLKKYGIDDFVLKWIDSYLNNRKQRVKCGEIVSKERNNDVGVPQGSILGPLLFILYINDLELSIKCCNFHIFADDTILFIAGENLDQLIFALNEEMKSVEEWLKTNKLKINSKKTKLMIVSSSYKYLEDYRKGIKVKVENTEIELVDHHKYLGFVIDSQLTCKEHIDYIAKKIARKLGVLNRCGRYLSWSTKMTVFNSIVLPHFYYSATIIYLASKSDVERLQKLQNWAMRIMLGCTRYTKIVDMLKTMQWLNVGDFAKLQSMIFVHKIKLKILPEYLQESLTTFEQTHHYETRNKQNFILPHINKSSTQKSIFFKGLVDYNKLPNDLKEIENINNFKIKLRKIMLSSYL